MVKCVVKKCNSRSKTHNKLSGITFHVVPRDEERRFKWMEIIRLLRKETDWIPTKSSAICSKHFRDRDKIILKGRVYLSKKAIPVLDDNGCSKDQKDGSLEENMEMDPLATDDEIEEITETPREHKMRRKVQHLQILSARRLKKIQSLLQKNRRLQIRNKKLKLIIGELTKITAEQRKLSAAKCKNDETVQLIENN
uniref:THAP-type domain-containing protein n=1 Tax=Heliothis virescens TaxID=7102 RepID=A0A2A4K4M7_HELVI